MGCLCLFAWKDSNLCYLPFPLLEAFFGFSGLYQCPIVPSTGPPTSAASTSPADKNKAWLILAWVSTVAGNFSLLGSAANLIVCEQAQRSLAAGYTLSFWSHLRFGIPSTLMVTAIGVPLIRG